MILYGQPIYKALKLKLCSDVLDFKKNYSYSPCLSVVLVGQNPASQIYVSKKIAACKEIGLDVVLKELPEDVSENEIKEMVSHLNSSKEINGILVQLPLPSHLDEQNIISYIDPLKDVDGLTPYNRGLLSTKNPQTLPCTPLGVIELLKGYKISIEGKRCTVVGRSLIVGQPMAQILLNHNATVTVCHSHTKDLNQHLLNSDIVVVAAGKKEFLNSNHFNKNCVVIDVGIHREGNKIKGDVDFEDVKNKVKAISPVPGGVGVMTVCCLLKNTLQLARLQMRKKS